MSRLGILFCLASIFYLSCQGPLPAEQHIIYLHGRIVELQGTEAISPRFGPYLFRDIVAALGKEGARVYADVRPATVDFFAYCDRVSHQIDSLIDLRVEPANITVVGASKGAVMAMQVAHQNPHPINYVLLGANNEYIEQENEWSLHGRVLGIYEKTDSLAGRSYDYWIARSTEAQEFQQLEINTGLGHGFLYQPMPEWLEPIRKWSSR